MLLLLPGTAAAATQPPVNNGCILENISFPFMRTWNCFRRESPRCLKDLCSSSEAFVGRSRVIRKHLFNVSYFIIGINRPFPSSPNFPSFSEGAAGLDENKRLWETCLPQPVFSFTFLSLSTSFCERARFFSVSVEDEAG